MSSQVSVAYCPVYRDLREAAPWKDHSSSNAGLIFDKFGDAWQDKTDRDGKPMSPRQPEFDKGVGKDRDAANAWLQSFNRPVGSSVLLSEACFRQRSMVNKLGGRVLCLTNLDRFVTGMGREHPLENGLAWHHTLGVPYLPGSSLKGTLGAWLREETDDWDWARHRWTPQSGAAQWLGTQKHAGRFILLDMLPIRRPQLCVDVMTPHYGPYYQQGDDPGDWHSPNPISFLAVAQNQFWQLAILPTGGDRLLDEAPMDAMVALLTTAIEVCGAGAKTAVGYGRFKRDESEESRLIAADAAANEERIRKQSEEVKRQEKAALLASLPPDVAAIMRRAEGEGWSSGPAAFMQGLPAYLDQNPTPSSAVIQWIISTIIEPHWKAAWANPTGSAAKKLKPKQMELLHRLQRHSAQGHE